MKIEVLYFQGCRNHGPSVDRLQAVLAAEGVAAEVEEIEVNDAATAEAMKFLGSPTIRVNGIDVETSWEAARPMGLLRRAISDAKIQEERR